MTTLPLTAAEARDLRALAAEMIPASTAYDVPGADDDTIFADILKSLERDTDDARTALAHLAKLAGGAFADLAPDRRRAVAATFKQEATQVTFAPAEQFTVREWAETLRGAGYMRRR